jgi:signal transduction histidine kinase/DNA-binding response OmpR family regulator/ligand-binding sensor domain-containing protein
MAPARVLRAVCAGLLLSATLADAQVTPRFRVDYWTTDDGLPSTFISDLTSTRDGYLWLAAGGILTRFDGHTFRAYSPATDTAITGRVNLVYAGIGDTLWATLDDGWIASVAGGRVARLARMPNAAISQDDRGSLIALGSPMHRWEAGHFHEFPVPREWIPVNWFRPHARRDSLGVIWMPGGNESPLRITQGGAALVPFRATRLLTHRARGLVLFERRNGAITEIVDEKGVEYGRYRTLPGNGPALVDHKDRLWVTVSGAVLVYQRGSLEPIERIALDGGTDVGSVVEDAAGNIWVAGVGLARIQETPFRTVTRATGLSGNDNQIDRLTRGPRGSILARVTIGANLGIFRFDDFRATKIADGFPLATTDSRGTVWIFGPRSAGPNSLIGRRTGAPDVVMPVVGQVVLADDPARPGSMWVWARDKVFRTEPYAPNGPRISDSLSIGGDVRAAAVDAGGTIWIASTRTSGGFALHRYDGSALRTFTAADGYPTSDVRALLADTDGSVWIGTYGAGLVRFKDGRFESIREQNGLGENVASQILDDGLGNFWMAGNRSVHRVRIDEARAFLDGKAPRVHGIVYGRRDGLRNPETSGHEGVRADDGRLWLPTFGGAAVVDPARAIALDSVPPIVHVLGIRTSSDTLQEARDIKLPRGDRRVAVSYTGVSLRNAAGVRFEYRLEGVDNDWIYAGANREAVYNDVSPGKHTFRVRAINAGGAWSTRDATLDFTVPHFFYETIPFYLALAGLLALGVRYAVQLRERQLRLRQTELTSLVEERTGELKRALTTVEAQTAQLRSLDEAKSRFFANVSHEFRTPLSLILGPVEDIRDGRAGVVPDAARGKLDTVMSNVKRLVQLVEQLLDVARLESGTLQLKAEVRDLVPLLRRITESYGSLAERKGLSFQVTCPVGGIRVRYDPDQMEKIVGNLLGNALKFTPPGGRVELRAVTEGEGANGWAIVEVQDTGPGIPAAHQPRVFDRFYQVDDSPRRAHGGAGIGLALARELVDLHGGDLSLRSVEGAGSTFVVRLPLATSALHVSAETASQPPRKFPISGSSGRATPNGVAVADSSDDERADVTTVLVAEDNAELLGWLRGRLEDHYRVLEASNGAIALGLAREHVPDLIISDVMMPELDGQSLCEAVKKDPEIDFIPVILLTAKASRESRLAGLATGADDYLAKPVDMQELLVRADNLIMSRRRLRERYAAAQRSLPVLEVPLKPGPRDASADAFLEKMYAAIAAHVGDEAFQVDALASAVDMGRSTLYRKVEELLGRSPMDAVWEYRLEQAAQWLTETDANVSEIAYGVGFKSVPHFCSRFRTRYKATPSAYRRQRETGNSVATDKTETPLKNH